MMSETPFTMNVCGLLFTYEDEPRVVLALRDLCQQELADLSPSQQGITAFYDGLGGEVEWPEGVNEYIWEEYPRKQLSAYVYEQCGVITTPEQWQELTSIRGDNFEVRFLATCAADAINAQRQTAGSDRIVLDNPFALPINTISHLTWLIPLALDDSIKKPLGLQAI